MNHSLANEHLVVVALVHILVWSLRPHAFLLNVPTPLASVVVTKILPATPLVLRLALKPPVIDLSNRLVKTVLLRASISPNVNIGYCRPSKGSLCNCLQNSQFLKSLSDFINFLIRYLRRRVHGLGSYHRENRLVEVCPRLRRRLAPWGFPIEFPRTVHST